MKRNLNSEQEIIIFYVTNLEKLNYSKNKKKISNLIFDSLEHAGMITAEIMELQKNAKGKLDKKTRDKALKEETGLKEIYKYEFKKTKEAKALKVLNQLILEETKHEKIVKTLK